MSIEPVTLHGPGGARHGIYGETTPAAGLYIVPEQTTRADGKTWTGRWWLLHGPTGQPLTLQAHDGPAAARRLAQRLAGLCPDWTRLGPDPDDWPDQLGARVRALLRDHALTPRVAPIPDTPRT